MDSSELEPSHSEEEKRTRKLQERWDEELTQERKPARSTSALPAYHPADAPAKPLHQAEKRSWMFWVLLGSLFLLGMLCGIGSVAGYILVLAQGDYVLDGQAVPAQGQIVVHADRSYITHLLEQNIDSAGIPGHVKNVRVRLVRNGPITVTGENEVSVLGIAVTRRFSIDIRLVVTACHLQVRVERADLEGIPITTFVAVFEQSINEQLQERATTLPKGFTYCMTGASTEPTEVIIIYSAVPIK